MQHRRTLASLLSAPVNIHGAFGAREGEVLLTWDRIPGCRAYQIQISPDGAGNWSFCGTATKCRTILAGLESGARYFFRVAAIGPVGQSGWSDPGLGRAL